MKSAVLVAAVLLASSTAHAYHNADFATPVSAGGGNGIYFTGSPRAKRLDCTACHALAEKAIGIELASEPPELIAEQRWTPGQTYRLTVTMTGEHLGDTTSTSGYNHNGFVAELDDDAGRRAGAWTSLGPETFTMDVAGGDPQVVAGASSDGGTIWVVELVAPPAGAGRLTLHLGAVDGNAAGGGVATVVDPFGDDVFVGAWRFCEGASACDTRLPDVSEASIDEAHRSPATGCRVGADAGTQAAFVVFALLIVLGGFRRPTLLVVVAVAGLTGCLDDGADPIFDECPNGICEYSSENEPLGTNPLLDRSFFRCQVQPVLQARCANFACHGAMERPLIVFGPNRLRLDGENSGETVAPTTPMELEANFDNARELVRDDIAADSLLLLKPLDSSANGYYHFGESLYYGSDVFTTTDDLGYRKILEWISGATASADCVPTSEVGL